MPQTSFDPSLNLILSKASISAHKTEDFLELCFRNGVTLLQLREKDCDTKEFVMFAKALRNITKLHHIPLIINDRVDVAMACDANGVHLGQSDMRIEDARRLLGPKKIIGLTIETWENFETSQKQDVDYLGVSSLYPTESKTDCVRIWPKEDLRRLVAASKLPLVGIGGINHSNAKEVLDSGLDGIATISSICAAKNPALACHQYRKIIQEHKNAKSSQLPNHRRIG